MSQKLALLVGVSEYQDPHLKPLAATPNDVAALQRVLQDGQLGGFDRVEPLLNPNAQTMQLEIAKLFHGRKKSDLVLLFFAGHGFTYDSNGQLYLAACNTDKSHIMATAVAASFIQNVMADSASRRQVIILDCCYSGAFSVGWQARGSSSIDVKQLGGEGRAVLTSSSSTQISFEHEGSGIYTRYLVEGIETGAAERDGDGQISIAELHEYAQEKVQEARPDMKPQLCLMEKEGYRIILAKAPMDKKLEYRRAVEGCASQGEISSRDRATLAAKRTSLGLTDKAAKSIEDEVLAPHRKKLKNLQIYAGSLQQALAHQYPLSLITIEEFKDLQEALELTNEDVQSTRDRILAQAEILRASSRRLDSSPSKSSHVPASQSAVEPNSDRVPQCQVVPRQRSWQCVKVLTGHDDRINAIALTPDGQLLVSGSTDKTVRIWDLNTGEICHRLTDHLDSVNSVAISAQGSILASASNDKTVKLWNLNTAKLLRSLGSWLAPAHLYAVNAVAISANSELLATASLDHTIKLWNLQTGKQLHSLTEPQPGDATIAISPDDCLLACDGQDHTIQLWDLRTKELLHVLRGHSDWVWSVAISPDGTRLASGSQDNTLRLWNLNTQQLLWKLAGHRDAVRSVAFSGDGQTVASGSYDSTIKLWNLSTGQEIQTLSGHKQGVNAIAFSGDGQILVSGSSDRTIRVWQHVVSNRDSA